MNVRPLFHRFINREYAMRFTAILMIAMITAGAFAQENDGLSYNYDAYRLTQSVSRMGQTAQEKKPADSPFSDFEPKSPGKALLLSAIIPGAGEFYAGSKLKGLLFLSLEVAAWTGVAVYQQDGRDKENKFIDYANSHWSKFRYWYWLETYLVNFNDFLTEEYPTNPPDKTVTGSFNGNTYMFYPYHVYEEFEEFNGFTHNLPSSADQQYYEMIGKYLTQFGPGWDDCSTPDDTASVGGTTDRTYYWDGDTTPRADHYGTMRYNSNQAFEYASYCFQAVMLNHVISALDAGFTVRLRNRKIETAFNVYPKNNNGENVTMGQVTVNW